VQRGIYSDVGAKQRRVTRNAETAKHPQFTNANPNPQEDISPPAGMLENTFIERIYPGV